MPIKKIFCLNLHQNHFAMSTLPSATAPSFNLEFRKLVLIQRILDLSDEGELSLLENLFSPQPAESGSLTPEVIALLEQRLASLKENPHAGASWEIVRQRLLSRRPIR
jgi:hypothetical protein